jgi:hypothetical protein
MNDEYKSPFTRSQFSNRTLIMKNPISIQEEIQKLHTVDAYILKFYHSERENIHLIPDKVGSLYHKNFLIKTTEKDPDLKQIHAFLKATSRQTFSNKSKKMLQLSEACAQMCKF